MHGYPPRNAVGFGVNVELCWLVSSKITHTCVRMETGVVGGGVEVVYKLSNKVRLLISRITDKKIIIGHYSRIYSLSVSVGGGEVVNLIDLFMTYTEHHWEMAYMQSVIKKKLCARGCTNERGINFYTILCYWHPLRSSEEN